MSDTIFLDSAARIANRLCRDAIWAGPRCNWLGWAVDVFGHNWSLVYKAQPPYLYDGTAGIALFLARAWRGTGDPAHRDTAIGALNHALGALPGVPEEIHASVYSGALGIAYAAVMVGQALEDEAIVRRGLRDAARYSAVNPKASMLDVLGGSAGAIQVLVQLDLVDAAREHGEHLLKTAVRSDRGLSWDTMPGQTSAHLCGYGHGAGGIGTALLEVWSATGEECCRRGAVEAFRYEASHFNAEHRNWPDLREMPGFSPPDGQKAFGMAWCHGAPGVGLSRLRAHQLLPNDRAIASDLEHALATTDTACRQWVPSPMSGLSLCHGLGGNADLLIAAADVLERPALRRTAEDAARNAIQQIEPHDMPWPCGVNQGGETPNLMLGLAGIGHFFLRLWDSTAVSSMLLIQGGVGVPACASSGKKATALHA